MTIQTDLREVSVDDVTRYLRSTGWSPAADLGGRATVWALDQVDREVIVPASARFLDYPQRMRELFETLASTESRPEKEVFLSITEPYVDRQYFRTFPDAPSGMIPISDGAEAFLGIRELLIAAAQAEHSPSAGFTLPRRKARVVEDFPNKALVTTEPGSFVITTHVRLPHHDATLFAAGDPFERRVLGRMSEVVRIARDAAIEAAERAELTPFTERQGINRTLCRALSRLGGTDNDQSFEVRFAWASAVPAEAPTEPILFQPDHVTMLRHAADDLGRRPHTEEAEMIGRIKQLERHHSGEPGWVVVHGWIVTAKSRHHRQAWVRLAPRDYERALAAHAMDRDVRVVGSLTRTGNRTEFSAPTSFEA